MNTYKNRRQFLRNAGMLTAGSLMLPSWGCQNKPAPKSEDTDDILSSKLAGSINKFGLQLYTLRDIIYDDPKSTIQEISKFGYKQIEGYEGDIGLFWGMSNVEFKSLLDDQGLEFVASHCDIFENFEKKASQLAEIGVEYLICPSVDDHLQEETWQQIADRFNQCGETCKSLGIKFGYHNHDYSFKAYSGMIPHDFLMKNTDPELVKYELDIYWAVTSGADPIAYLNKYPNRFKLVHVKDRQRNVTTDVREATCNLGTGIIDFPKILKIAADNGTEHFIVEQEQYPGTTPLGAAKAGADYLKVMQFS